MMLVKFIIATTMTDYIVNHDFSYYLIYFTCFKSSLNLACTNTSFYTLFTTLPYFKELSILNELSKTVTDKLSKLNLCYEHGLLNLLKKLRLSNCQHYVLGAHNCASKMGHIQLLSWLVTTQNDHFDYYCSIINSAAIHNKVTVLDWTKSKMVSHKCYGWATYAAAIHGSVDVLEWLHSNEQLGCYYRAVRDAKRVHQTATLNWFASKQLINK